MADITRRAGHFFRTQQAAGAERNLQKYKSLADEGKMRGPYIWIATHRPYLGGKERETINGTVRI